MKKEWTRRDFLKGAATGAAAVAAAGILEACQTGAEGMTAAGTTGSATSAAETTGSATNAAETAEKAAETKGAALADEVQEPVIEELPIPDVPAPEVTEYETEILVVGSGFAGIPAAVEAKEAGKEVLLVDKGYPGYSGCSPFPQCYQFFSEEYGDDRETQIRATQEAGEYIANLDWYNVYLDESRECFDQLVEWGIYQRFPKASEAGDYFDEKRYQDYHDEYAQYDRRANWNKLLQDKEIPFVAHTMIVDLIQEDGRIIGAMGLHVPSGTVITFHAKAVILCVGGGSYKNGGWPVSGDTFDGEWMAYQAGASIAGKEFTYMIATSSVAPACCWRNYTWGYLENIHPVGATYTPETVDDYISGRAKSFVVNKINNITMGVAPIAEDAVSTQPLSNPPMSTSEDDPRRIGNDVDPMPSRNIEGAAIGKGTHKCEGIFCGVDDLVGYTGIPGLYAAGDALASMIYGALYTPGQGGSVPVSHIQGRRAAKAACEYAETVELKKIDKAAAEEKAEELLAPMKLERGFNPYWVQDNLMGIMSPYWVDFVKNEASLTNALDSVMNLQTNVVPKLIATNPHELRVCHEVKHKVLSAEIKLRESLARKESRGYCQRSDYPFRDDENFLCYITARKGEDGEMRIEKVPVKDEWKGDLSKPYTERYRVYYPGEIEALNLDVDEQ